MVFVDKETGWYGFCVLDSETMLRKEMVSERGKGRRERERGVH